MRPQSVLAGIGDPSRSFQDDYLVLDKTELAIEADCGRFFKNLRRHFDVPRKELAAQLGCPVSVIAALERGDAGDLPAWPETVRIVTAMTQPLGIDPRPALQLIGRRWGGGALDEPLAARPAPTRAEPLGSASWERPNHRGRIAAWSAKALLGGSWAWPSLRRLPPWPAWRVVLAVGVPLAFLLFAARPIALEAASASVPEPLAQFARGAREFILHQVAPSRDGLRWIEVDDPRSRRGDKLRSAGR